MFLTFWIRLKLIFLHFWSQLLLWSEYCSHSWIFLLWSEKLKNTIFNSDHFFELFSHSADFSSRILSPHLSTAIAWREKKCKHFVFNKYFSLVLGLLKSRISEKNNQLLLNKLDFKLFHYKARVQPVSKITTVATRNKC